MLGRIGFDDFSPLRASGRSTLQVLSIQPPTIYVARTLADAAHIMYLVEKHTELTLGKDVVVVPMPEVQFALQNYPGWFVEVDHWLRPWLPGMLWELITARNQEATDARNDGHSSP